jgi:competence ComEA-like helix-hairpin-helix protein
MKRHTETLIGFLLISLLIGVPGLTGPSSALAQGTYAGAQGRLNVNTASKEELARLLFRQGLGNAVELSENIVAYRESNGPLADIGELRRIRGIGGYELERIRPRLKVRGESDYRPLEKGSRPAYPFPGAPAPRNGYPPGHNYPDDEPYGPWRIRP